ncbi:MAG: GNAT family N-acetyltransferase [Erysipelotrichaceae bacterium]|nr:GNAT family N-acetyltransferase [Erysipelotrichaceae bacterium]
MFNLFAKRKYEGPVVDLKEKYRFSERTAYDGVPAVYYDIYTHNESKKVGTCDLRLKNDGDMYYFGNIGYNVLPSYRGHNYAYYACLLMFEIAKKEFGLNELIITCSPENKASYKILEKLDGEFIETVDVPKDHELYLNGEKVKCIFRYKL